MKHWIPATEKIRLSLLRIRSIHFRQVNSRPPSIYYKSRCTRVWMATHYTVFKKQTSTVQPVNSLCRYAVNYTGSRGRSLRQHVHDLRPFRVTRGRTFQLFSKVHVWLYKSLSLLLKRTVYLRIICEKFRICVSAFWPFYVCNGSVVVTAYDFESARPGSSRDQNAIRLRSLHMAHPSLHSSGVVHWVPEQLNLKAVTGHASWLMAAAYKVVFGHAFSCIISSGLIGHRNRSKLNCMQRLCDWVKGSSKSVS